jgi:hypothetical protein
MKVIKTENEGKAWSLYGKGGLAFTAETQEELVAKTPERLRANETSTQRDLHVGRRGETMAIRY